jgi:hypothetical protein
LIRAQMRLGAGLIALGALSVPRAAMTGCEDTWLDEALEILTAAWFGTPVHHHGRALRSELAEQTRAGSCLFSGVR